jgi:hypothetical protein
VYKPRRRTDSLTLLVIELTNYPSSALAECTS